MKNNATSLPVPTESVEQQCLFRWAAFQSGRFPELALLYHVPNGGSRKKAEAGRFRAEGVKAGVPDYGIQRDKAARMAARVGEFGSYEALFLSLRPSLAFWQMGAAARRAGRTIRQAARAFGDMFAAMGTALAACFSPALRGYVEGTKEREQKQADFSAAGNMFLPSTHEIIAGAQPEEENTAARWWVKTPNQNYGKPQAEERQG